MSDPAATTQPMQTVDRSRLMSGWPMLIAVAVWTVGLPLLSRIGGTEVTGRSVAILVGFAVIAALIAGVVLLRMPADPVAIPFVGMTAAVATLLALAPLDLPAHANSLAGFLLVAPWRYALTPLVVHFALEIGWAHRRQQWAGWVVGWYAVELGMVLVVAIGLSMNEVPLVDAVDNTLRAAILEPVGALAALISALLALATPFRGRVLRAALAPTITAVAIGLGPLLLSDLMPVLARSLDGAVTPARLALFALPLFGMIAVLSLPFRDAAARDLAAHRLAAGLLDGTDLSGGLRQIAEELHGMFGARGVTVRLVEPETAVTVGEIVPVAAASPVAPDVETGDDQQALVAPIGRSGNPLGEVRLEARFVGAFGATERQWLIALLQPIAAVLRARRREFNSVQRNAVLVRQFTEGVGDLALAAQQLPLPPADEGLALPPLVDAREVLAQLSDGMTGVARHGEGLGTTAGETRDCARGTSDSIARALDTLSALNIDVIRLARHGEDIAASNDTVSGVAFRTNLVANNAALEATRAGPAGRTFGVLAEEVRRLADTTAATSTAIGAGTAALAAGVAGLGIALEGTRRALATAIREAEAGEAAAQRLSEAAAELEDAARSLRPAVAEANAVAKRRSARDQHLTAAMERFVAERTQLARALTDHRDAMDHLARALDQVVR
ncbi:MAG: methyl-accepting chemotaxis protein [Gemmatimonadales bacterium]